MAITPLEPTAHPVLRSAVETQALMSGAFDLSTLGMDAADTGAALRVFAAVEAQAAAMQLLLVAHGERVDLPGEDAKVSMWAWLRDELHMAPRDAKQMVALAAAMARHEPVAAALAAGEVPVRSAAIIATTLEGLPKDADPVEAARAEQQLVAWAKQHDTGFVRETAKRIDYVMNQERAEQREEEALRRAEMKAAQSCFAHLWHDEKTATTTGTFTVPLVQGLKLQRQLEALGNPQRPDPIPFERDGHLISADERRGQALCQLIDRIPKGALPKTGGCDPLIVATMTLEQLLGQLKPVLLDTGHRISAGLARRLAAEHGIIPAVLGGESEVLDLGRKARLASGKQRLALSVVQHGCCGAEGCDSPAAWADANHVDQWGRGGRTDLNNLILLCKRHHRMADNARYVVTRLGPGCIRINRRT